MGRTERLRGSMTFENVPIEQVAAFWSRRPCNIRHSLIDIDKDPLAYSKAVTARKRFVEPHIAPFADFQRWDGKAVLEVGCGIGTDTLDFARHGAEVVAVDLSAKSLEVAEKRARAEGLADRIEFVQGDAESLDAVVPVRPFDLVYSFGVIHHTPHYWRALGQAQKYLWPGGTFKFMVYNRRSWRTLQILWETRVSRYKSLDERIAAHSEAQTGCPVTWTFSKRQIRSILSYLWIKEIRAAHIFKYEVEPYIHHKYVEAMPWRLVPSGLFQVLERLMGWHLLVTAER